MKTKLLLLLLLAAGACPALRAQAHSRIPWAEPVFLKERQGIMEQKMHFRRDGKLVVFYNYTDTIYIGARKFAPTAGNNGFLLTLTDTHTHQSKYYNLKLPSGMWRVNVAASDSKERIYVSGDITGYLSDSSNFLAVFDTSGNMLRRYACGGHVSGQGLAVDKDDNVYVSGYVLDSMKYGGNVFKKEKFAGWATAFVLKLDVRGDLVWMKHLNSLRKHARNSGYYSHTHAIEIGRNGDVFLTGHFKDNIVIDTTFLQAPADSSDPISTMAGTGNYALCLKNDGSVRWIKFLESLNNSNETYFYLVQDDAGYIYPRGMVGGFYKLDAGSGVAVYQKHRKGSITNAVTGIDRSGHALTAIGELLGPAGDTLAKMNWPPYVKSFLTGGSRGVFYGLSGSLSEVGLDSQLYSNDFKARNYKAMALFRLEMDTSLYAGKAEGERQAASFRLFPNPARESVNIFFPEAATGELTLYTMEGRIVMAKKIQGANTADLSLQSLSRGVYLLRFMGKDGRQGQRLVVRE